MEFWLRVSGWVFVALCVVTGVVLVLGGRLPEHQVRTALGTVEAPPAEVWAVLADVENLPRWQTGVRAVSPMPEQRGLPCWRESRRFASVPVCVTEEQTPRQWVERIVDARSPLQESWIYELRPVAGGTELRVTEAVDVAPAMWRFARRYLAPAEDGPEQRLGGLRQRLGHEAR